MALAVKKGSFTTNSGTAPFDQAVTGIGLGVAGEAAIFFFTNQSAEGTAAQQTIGIGFAVSASSEGTSEGNNNDNVTTTDNGSRTRFDRCIFAWDGIGTTALDAEFKQWDGTDGNFTITWQTNPGAGKIVHYIILGGTDLTNAVVTEVNLNATAGSPQSYAHGLGATPDFALFATTNTTSTGGQNNMTFAVGWAVQGTASTRKSGSVSVNASDAETMEANQDQMRVLASDRPLICMGNSVATVDIELDYPTTGNLFDGTNVNFNQINAPTLNTDMLCLFLKGGQYDAGSFAARTTTGADNFTVGFVPKGVMLMMAQGITSGTAHTETANANMAFGGFSASDGTQEGSVSISSTDAIEPTQADQRTLTTKCITSLVNGNPGTVDAEADGTALGTTSTINWTDAPGTADIVLWCAIGQAATGAFELNAEPGSYAVTGAAANMGIGVIASPGSYALTGAAATLEHGYPMNAEPGSYAVTGQPATLTGALLMNAAPGSYVITGQGVNFGLGMNAGPGSYGITGQPVNFALGFTAAPGSYAITGQPANFGIAMNAGPGSYTLTGFDATLSFSGADPFTLVADPGSYAITGASATLAAGYQFNAQAGSYAISGAAAALSAGFATNAEPGSYAITGAPAFFGIGFNAGAGSYVLTGSVAGLLAGYAMNAEAGSYTLTGFDATLTYTPAVTLVSEPPPERTFRTDEVRTYLISSGPRIFDI